MFVIKKILFLFIILIPFSSYSNDYNYVDLNNFKDVINDKKIGLYYNPIEDNKIFLLLFDENSDHLIDKLPEKYDDLIPYTYFYTTISGVFVAHIQDEKNDLRFNVFNFNANSDTGIFVSNIFKGTDIENYFKEMVFLHEIFHLHHEDIKDYDIEEIKSDFFASIALGLSNNYQLEDIQKLFNEFSYLRFNFLNKDFKNREDLIKFKEKLSIKLKSNYKHIENIESFKDIATFINLI